MSQTADNNPQTPEDPVTEVISAVIQCFVEWLKSEEPNEQKGHRILCTLAEESFKVRTYGRDQRCFSAKDLALAAEKPTDWIDWKATEKYFEARKDNIIDFAKGKGLVFYPEFKRNSTSGGPRNVATCEIAATPIPESTQVKVENTGKASKDWDAIQYSRSDPSEVTLAWLWRIVFRKGELIMNKWKKWLILSWIFSIIIIVTLVVFILFLSLSVPKPITTQVISIIIMMIAFPVWAWFEVIRPFNRLFDDRIKVASESMLAWGEDDAQMEIYREDDLRVIRIVRYSASCSICGAEVRLSDGFPDFPSRMVGRCAESPREHVFSFDRVTRRGSVLRSPPVV
jgi:hypothetical protein